MSSVVLTFPTEAAAQRFIEWFVAFDGNEGFLDHEAMVNEPDRIASFDSSGALSTRVLIGKPDEHQLAKTS